VKIYLATWLEDKQGGALTVGKARHRLLSFYFLEKSKVLGSEVRQYIMTGSIPPRSERKKKNED
jgi:hypothetical protein